MMPARYSRKIADPSAHTRSAPAKSVDVLSPAYDEWPIFGSTPGEDFRLVLWRASQ
jgi:hypothetical protein